MAILKPGVRYKYIGENNNSSGFIKGDIYEVVDESYKLDALERKSYNWIQTSSTHSGFFKPYKGKNVNGFHDDYVISRGLYFKNAFISVDRKGHLPTWL